MGKTLNVSTTICILLLISTITSSTWLNWRHRSGRRHDSSSDGSSSWSSDGSSSSSSDGSSSSSSDSSSSSSSDGSSSSSSDSSSSSSSDSSSSSSSSSSSDSSSSSSSDSSSSSSDSSSSSSSDSSSSSSSDSSSDSSSSSSSDSSSCDVYDQVQCKEPEDLTDGTVSYSGTGFEDTVTYACNDGFQLIGSPERTCLSTGMWSGTKPTCAPACDDYDQVQCEEPEDLTDGTVSYSGTGFEDTVTYACNDGFQLIGSPERTCLSTGMWSGTKPTCAPAQCPALTAPEQGTVDVTGPQPIGTIATYTCNFGLVSGDIQRFCLPSGMWSGTEPVCNEAQCPALTAPELGTVDVTGPQPIDTMATYTCDFGLVSGDLQRFCLPSGMWNGTEPVCDADSGLVCTFGGWKRHGCSANANVQSNECRVPNVGNILIATVHQLASTGTGNFQCNAATYPLAADATFAFAWNEDVIYLTDDCRAVFNVVWETCVEDPTQSCTRKHKRHGCSANANVQSNQCRVPNVDNIQYATVHNAVAGHVCNPTSYPLAVNATESYTWDGEYIYMDDDCRAVFNVYYDECEPVTP